MCRQTHVFIYVYECVDVHMIYRYIHTAPALTLLGDGYISVHTYTDGWIDAKMHACMCVCVCMYVSVHACMHACMHRYTSYIHTHAYACIYR